MDRNLDNIREISVFLMMMKTNRTRGYSAAEIAEKVPTLKERSIYRILRDYPQFVPTDNSIHPRRYYFDPSRINDSNLKKYIAIRPEFIAGEPLDLIKFYKSLIDNFKGCRVFDELMIPILTSGNNAVEFTKGNEQLKAKDWAISRKKLNDLQHLSAMIYQRIEEIRSHPNYDTAEWWEMFKGDSNGS